MEERRCKYCGTKMSVFSEKSRLNICPICLAFAEANRLLKQKRRKEKWEKRANKG